MKKIYFLLAACALMATGCDNTQNEPKQNEPIPFSTNTVMVADSIPFPPEVHAHPAEIRFDGRLRFFERDLHRADLFILPKHRVAHDLGGAFQQIVTALGKAGGHGFNDFCVADGVLHVVRLAGHGEIQLRHQIDDKGLAVELFLGVDAVVRKDI